MRLLYRSMLAPLLLLGQAANSASTVEPHTITVLGDQIYPESFTWSQAQHRYFVSSVRHGTVGAVDTQGRYTPFITDDALVATYGLKVDDRHHRIWVAVGDRGTSVRSTPGTMKSLSAVAVYDSRTGARIAWHDLTMFTPGLHLANDMAIDRAGNAYVTDSLAGVIYRIGINGVASVFANSPLFHSGAAGLSLNGILLHPDGFLIVSTHNTSEIFRIDLAQPQHVERVAITGVPHGLDGIVLTDPQHMLAAINADPGLAVRIVSTDGWHTARLAGSTPSQTTAPTAIVVVDGVPWMLNSRLDTLRNPKAEKHNDFLLQPL